MESRRDGVGIVQGRDAEIDRLGLVIDPHVKRRRALAAKAAMAETARLYGPHRIRPRNGHPIAGLDAGEGHGSAPEFSWQVRQWHQPASNGSLLSSKRTVP